GIAVRRRARLIAFVLHDAGHQLANVALIVNDQDIKRHILLCPAGSGPVREPIHPALLPIPPPCSPTTATAPDAGSASRMCPVPPDWRRSRVRHNAARRSS